MAAGKISLYYSGTNLHLVYLQNDDSAWEYIQTPNNTWSAKNQLPSAMPPGGFQAIKLVQGVGSTVMAIGLDTSGPNSTGGVLWCATSDDNGNWNGFTQLPNNVNDQEIYFSSFDAVSGLSPQGVVVAAISPNGTTYTQTTPDCVNWTQPGWSGPANNSTPYNQILQAWPKGIKPPTPYSPWPPSFSQVAAGVAGAVQSSGGPSAYSNFPVIAGLDPNLEDERNTPLPLFGTAQSSINALSWQWPWSLPSTTQQELVLVEPGNQEKMEPFNVPAYPVSFKDVFYYNSTTWWGPILLLLGNDGQLYFIEAAALGAPESWNYYAPSPLQTSVAKTFTKARMAMGFAWPNGTNSDGVGNIQLVAVDNEYQFAYLFWQDGSQPNPLASNWNYAGPLPTLTPAKQIVDFDIAMGATALQVAYLASDGSVFINFQTQDTWGVYGGLD